MWGGVYAAFKSVSPFSWTSYSGLANDTPIADLDYEALNEANDIIQDIYRGGPLAWELRHEMKIWAGHRKHELMRAYFRALDIMAYSKSYQDVLALIEQELPGDGIILDEGAGTGNLSLLIKLSAPNRIIHMMDLYQEGLAMARIKWQEAGLGNPHTRVASIFREGGPKADAAVINHVTYMTNHPGLALESVGSRVRKGATVVWCEPTAPAATQRGASEKWMTLVITEAIANGAPHTEQEVAFLAGAARGLLAEAFGRSGEFKIQTLDQRIASAEKAGFTVKKILPAYNGFSQVLVLEKI